MTIPTSVDSLSPNSPFIKQLVSTESDSSIQFHNIVGNVEHSSWLEKLGSEPGDGVVSLESAKLPNALSEVEVPAEHQQVHQHPKAILEVKRILIENLVMTKRIDMPMENNVRHVSHEVDVKNDDSIPYKN